ncbi:MAG TPA: glycosyltransferase [Prosthecochloris aestuarii]|uniref:Glycosyltransferase n=1 Tax=Prosthecochloris aestuarii TaxID=1102 RepID=A0A831WPL6_PROAE|nr:glycosyltransferase [Prosthecochloris aestuarii]
MTLSIIIPTYNESAGINALLAHIFSTRGTEHRTEIIVSDSGTDNTRQIAGTWPVNVIASPKGRAVQMNRGASVAQGEILYFLHADTVPPPTFARQIVSAVENGAQAGCFRMTFDDPHWLMQTYGWFTRLPLTLCRGGDQSLFITRKLFDDIGGFDESLRVMEDIDIIERIERRASFHILPMNVTTSSRKYRKNGRIRLQALFGCMHLFYTLGFDQDIMAGFYDRNID